MSNIDLTDIIKSVRQPSFDDEMIKQLIEGLGANHYYTYIQKQNRISIQNVELDREAEKELWEKKAPGYNQKGQFRHMGSTNDIEYVFSRLYVNCTKSDLMELAKLFTDKCAMKEIPVYFKYSSDRSTRADQMVIYSNLDNLGDYIQILQEIGQENPQIIERCGKPPLLTGSIDEWIGIGDEPTVKNTSYTEIRSNIIRDVLDKIVPHSFDDIENNYTEKVDYDIVREELRKAFEEIGINIDTFAFNNENLQLYMSSEQIRQKYSEQRKEQIKEEKKRIIEEKNLEEYYLGELVPIQELIILKKIGIMPEIIETMTDAVYTRYGLLRDMTGKEGDINSCITNKFDLLHMHAYISNEHEIKVIESANRRRDMSYEEKEKLGSLLLSDLTKYYTNFFNEEHTILDETLSRYSQINEIPREENTDLNLEIERINLFSRLKILAEGKEFFKTIGISQESLEVVCDRVQYFLQDLKQKKEEKEKPENEAKRKAQDRDFLQAVFQQTGITEPEELRKLYESQDEIIVSEDDLEAVLSSFSNSDAPINPSHIETAVEKVGVGLTDINKSTQAIREELSQNRTTIKGDETRDE